MESVTGKDSFATAIPPTMRLVSSVQTTATNSAFDRLTATRRGIVRRSALVPIVARARRGKVPQACPAAPLPPVLSRHARKNRAKRPTNGSTAPRPPRCSGRTGELAPAGVRARRGSDDRRGEASPGGEDGLDDHGRLGMLAEGVGVRHQQAAGTESTDVDSYRLTRRSQRGPHHRRGGAR